ncbi:MAG: phosphogluconate dehydrogenase (NAD(+)-dependent, decarboxylating) [Candidatus Krumholzibacteriia bacterium]
MNVGMIGLGRMGGNMSERLIRGGHAVAGFDFSADAVTALKKRGGDGYDSLAGLLAALAPPRVLWMMVPSGDPVDQTIDALLPHLARGDTIIDGGNSLYKETMRRGALLAERGVAYVDVGTSGGVWGLAEGYSLMVGGDKKAVARLRPLFETLAPDADKGWGHVGPTGAGHFVKMIHNGIEYGMMQAFAEGMALLKKKDDFGLDLHQISEIWRHGSVVRSWLLDLIARALEENPTLEGIAPWVSDSGEGRWTVFEAIDEDVPAPVITLSLLQRLRSRDTDSFSDKMLAVMRQQFGGHAIKKED